MNAKSSPRGSGFPRIAAEGRRCQSDRLMPGPIDRVVVPQLGGCRPRQRTFSFLAFTCTTNEMSDYLSKNVLAARMSLTARRAEKRSTEAIVEIPKEKLQCPNSLPEFYVLGYTDEASR